MQRAAVSNVTLQKAVLYGTGGKASLKEDAYGNVSWHQTGHGTIGTQRDDHFEAVPVVRLADWAASRRPPVQQVEILKVDVEGNEWEVLQGAEPLFRHQRIKAVVLEYSHFWAAGHHGGAGGRAASLRAVAEWFSGFGYDGFLVGSPCLVPISGPQMEWWDDIYEVCKNPDARMYRGMAGWCWLNVAFLLRGSAAATAWHWTPSDLVPRNAEEALPSARSTCGALAERKRRHQRKRR